MKKADIRKKLTWALVCGAGCALLSLGLWESGWLDSFEHASWGFRVKLFGKASEFTPKIRVVLLDQDSLDWVDREAGVPWPWPREAYVPIVQFMQRAGAQCLAFDVLYTESGADSPEDDAALGDAIAASSNFVGALFLSEQSGAFTSWPDTMAKPRWSAPDAAQWFTARQRDRLALSRAAFPIRAVGDHAAQLGDVHDTPDSDGVFRRATPVKYFNGLAVPSLGLAAYLAGEGDIPRLRLEERWIRVGDRRLPVDGRGRVILNFRGPMDVYEPVSAAAIIKSENQLQAGETPQVAADLFRDAYVFFGFSAPGLLDLRATPISQVTPGVFVHVTLLDNLLAQDAIREVRWGWLALGLGLFSIGAAAGALLARKAWHHVVVFAVFPGAGALLALAAYPAGFWWPMVPQVLSAALAATAGLLVNYATEGRQKQFIKKAFQHYLSREVIERILDNPDQLQLGGERKMLSIFFSDVQGFSSFSERMGPQELTGLLNDYLSAMTQIIFEEGGTLDKYEGDAIIAFWNAPLDQGDHALRAVRAALRCLRKIEETRSDWEARFGVRIYARTGINTGEVVVGNMGSRDRFDYTVLGDAANLASRLEGANKAFGTFLMVSEETWKQTGGVLAGRRLGRIRVVGRKTPVAIYEPLGFTVAEAPDWLPVYERGMDAMLSKDWAAARDIFRGLGTDPVAQKYAAQCEKVLTSGDDWDVIWNLMEK